MRITKNLFNDATYCDKRVWLNENKREVGAEISDSALTSIETCNEIKKMLDNHIHNKSFNVVFEYEDTSAKIDMVVPMEDGALDLYIISSAAASERVSPNTISTMAFNKHIVSRSNMVNRCYVININGDYVRNGDIDLDSFLVLTDITSEVDEYIQNNDIESRIAKIKTIIPLTEEPSVGIGSYCREPYECSFWKYCSKHIENNSVFNLYRMSFPKKVELYEKGYNTMSDATLLNEKLNAKQKMQVDCALSGETHIDKEGIKKFIGTLTYPLYFLDFETIQDAIPQYDGVKPYQQLPFQYSLHYIEHEGGEVKHKEYLGESGKDNRRELAKRLCEDIPSDACVLAWYKVFECTRLEELSDAFEEYSTHLLCIKDNIIDLMTPFTSGYYYDNNFKGSFSLKSVLPAMFPNDDNLSYSVLEGVHNGIDAMETFRNMKSLNESEQIAVRDNLLKYCGLDTYSMVAILDKLNEIIK